MFTYQIEVESNEKVFNAVALCELALNPIFTTEYICNLSGQILAYYIEKWLIYSLPQFRNSRRTLLYHNGETFVSQSEDTDESHHNGKPVRVTIIENL